MDSRRGEVSRRDPRSEQGDPKGPPSLEQGDPDGSPFFFGSRRGACSGAFPLRAAGRTAVASALLALAAAASALGDTDADGRRSGATSKASATVVVLASTDASRLRALDCADGREAASFLLPSAATSVAPAPKDDSAFVASGAQLLRLRLPAFAPAARVTLDLAATSLVAAGGADAVVLAGGSGQTPLSARDPETLASLHEYPLDDGRRASVSSLVDRPRRSRIVVAFSDLDEIWEIDYRRDAPPVLRGLVHDYRMREAVELPGRFTPRAFVVPGATRALVGGSAPHEVLRIDASGALGVLNLDVRREIERPPVGAVPAPERIAAWQGEASRGWVLADEGAPALRVLDGASWKLVEPIVMEGEVLAIRALEDGSVLAALALPDAISLVRLDVELRRTREVSHGALQGVGPYRFVPGTNGCFALVDAENRWISGVAARAKRSGS